MPRESATVPFFQNYRKSFSSKCQTMRILTGREKGREEEITFCKYQNLCTVKVKKHERNRKQMKKQGFTYLAYQIGITGKNIAGANSKIGLLMKN